MRPDGIGGRSKGRIALPRCLELQRDRLRPTDSERTSRIAGVGMRRLRASTGFHAGHGIPDIAGGDQCKAVGDVSDIVLTPFEHPTPRVFHGARGFFLPIVSLAPDRNLICNSM